MDARVITWFLGPVVLLALVVNAARWVGARRLDPFAGRARRRAALGSLLGAVLAYAVALGGIDRTGETGAASGEGATAHPGLPALAAVAGIVVAALFEHWVPRVAPTGARREAALGIRRGTESVRLTRYVVGGLVLAVVGLVVGWVTSGPDGRTGARSWEGVVVTTTQAYPGRAFTLGTVLALVLLVAVTAWALRDVDARPALVDDPELDRALRLGARIRVLRWSAAGALVTAAGLCLTIGPNLNDVTQRLRGAVAVAGKPDAPLAPGDWTQNVAFAMTALGFAALAVALAAILWDAPVVPRSRQGGAAAPEGPGVATPPAPSSALAPAASASTGDPVSRKGGGAP
ncbi:hypothetical protein [Terrabacter sp. NPDC000476]|uniref:hypothetical protein n=1 Tax=Terrabacter sp. NPDC000476 TaxID=3154258 RepID=UPI003327A1FD